MFRGTATVEVGNATRAISTGICGSIKDVVHEVAELGKDGRIASCEIWIKIKKNWTRVKSVVMDMEVC